MTNDPSTGPIPREEFKELARAPAGEARKRIRDYDPLWGVREGEKIEWEVICDGQMRGRVIIKASSQEEADELADNLSDAEIDWECATGDFDVISVEPYKRKGR